MGALNARLFDVSGIGHIYGSWAKLQPVSWI